MLIALHNINGDIVFQNDHFLICHIKSTALNDQQPHEQVFKDIRELPAGNHFNTKNYFAPRYPEFLFITKTEWPHMVDTVNMEEIEAAALESPMGGTLQHVNAILKQLKGKTDRLFLTKFFLCARIKSTDLSGAILEFNDAPICAENAEYRFGTTPEGGFALRATKINDGQINGIYFINEFESIYLPVNSSNEEVMGMIAKVQKRKGLPGRISKSYIVFPTSRQGRPVVRIQVLKNLKTEDMLTYFGGGKQSQSKVETLSNCLQGLTKRNVPFVETGDEFFIQMAEVHDNLAETPFETLPLDYVLSRASHFRTLAAEQYLTKQHKTAVRMLVRVEENPVDDFAHALYTLLETNGKNTKVKIFGMENAVIKTILSKVGEKVGTNLVTA